MPKKPMRRSSSTLPGDSGAQCGTEPVDGGQVQIDDDGDQTTAVVAHCRGEHVTAYGRLLTP